MPTFTVTIVNDDHPTLMPVYRSGPNVLMAFETAARDAALYPVVYYDAVRHRRLFERCRKTMRRHSPKPAMLYDGALAVSVCLHP